MAFCKSCDSKIRAIWKKIDKTLIDNAGLALTFTTTLKKWLGSDVAIVITELFPGDLDNTIRKQLLSFFTAASTTLGIINSSTALPTDYMNVHNVLEYLGKKNQTEQNAILIKLASLITKYADNRYDTHLYDAAVQIIFSLNKLEK